MAEDLISRYIDRAAFASDTKFAQEQLATVEALYKQLRNTRINLADATGTSNIVNSGKQASTVLEQLKVKNAELTNTLKEQQIAIKAAAEERRKAALDEKAAAAQAKADLKQRMADEKAAAEAAALASREKIRMLAIQAKAEEELAELQRETQVNTGDVGSYSIAQGSGQASGAKVVGSTSAAAAQQVYAPSNQQEALLLNLSQTEALLKENQIAQKDLNEQLAQGKITQAEYDEQIVISKQEEIAYKATIQQTNAELKARQALNDSASGSIDAARAQNKLLIQERNALPTGDAATPEQTQRLKELNAEIDKNNELIDKNNDLLGRQKINIGNYPTALGETFKTLNTELESVQSQLGSGNLGGKEFDQLTAKQAALQNALSLTGRTFKTSAAEATAYKEAALQIGQTYGKDSDVFKQFAAGVKEGAIQNAALAKEVSGVATKGKGFLSFIGSAYNGLRKLAYLIPGAGIGTLVLLLLGPLQAAGAELIKLSNNSTKAGRDFQDFQTHVTNLNAVIEKSGSAFEKANGEVNKLTEDVRLAKEGFIKKDEVLKEYNDTMGKTTGKLTSFDAVEKKIVEAGPAYIKLMFLKAEATSAYALAAEAARKVLTAQTDAEKDFGYFDQFMASTKSFFSNFGAAITNGPLGGKFLASAGKNAADQINKNAVQIKKDQEKSYKDLLKQGDDFEKQAAELAKKFGFAFDPTKNTKGGGKGSENIYDQYRKKALQAQQELIKAQNEAELKGYKTIADDQQASLQERLAAEDNYYKKSKAITLQSVQDQIDAVNLEADLSEKRANTIKDPKKRADAQAAIEDYRTKAVKKIHELGNAELLKDDEDYYSATVNISTQAFDKIKKEAEDATKFIVEQQKIAFQNQKDQVDINKDDKLIQLEKDYNAGRIKNVQEYENRKKGIEQNAETEKQQLDLQRIQNEEKVFEALYGIKNINLIKQAKDLELSIIQKGNDAILTAEKELNDKKNQLLQQGLSTLSDFVEAGFDKRKAANDKEKALIDTQAQHQIDLINASTITEQQKADQTKIINERAAAQKQQIDQKQAKQDADRAKFEKAMSIIRIGITTAETVAKITAAAAVAKATYAAIPGLGIALGNEVAAHLLAQIPIVIATGALEIASVLAKPIPAFKTGKKNNYEGPAIVGDGGVSEYIKRADTGAIEKTPAEDTLTYLGANDIVFKDHVDMMKSLAMPAIGNVSIRKDDSTEVIGKKLDKIAKAVANKRELHIGASRHGMEAIWQWGSNQTKYVRENTNW